jgi:hypothetical protein
MGTTQQKGEVVNRTSQQLLESFEQLPEIEQQQIAIAILRRTLNLDISSLEDEELTLAAESIFLSLDEEEAEYEQQSESR